MFYLPVFVFPLILQLISSLVLSVSFFSLASPTRATKINTYYNTAAVPTLGSYHDGQVLGYTNNISCYTSIGSKGPLTDPMPPVAQETPHRLNASHRAIIAPPRTFLTPTKRNKKSTTKESTKEKRAN